MNLSVITINLNNYHGLVKTLNSLISSKRYISEHWVIDGDSSDIEQSLLDLSLTYKFDFVSEKDHGIYDAMNKGLIRSNSDYLLFLNSGDILNDDYEISEYYNVNNSFDLVFSDIIVQNIDSKFESNFPDFLTLEFMICYGLPHPSTVIKKKLFDKIGPFDINYKIISDWVFFMEALFYHKASYFHINKPLVIFDGTGISNQNSYLKQTIQEQLDYISKRFPQHLFYYKMNSFYVRKYFRQIPIWKRYFLKYAFIFFNYI
jgi:glycosyltransferase involved in cell wall biosynthesis